MKGDRFRADATLMLAAFIWGFGFVAQRAGMEHVGPFVFNAVRFAIGAVSLVPLLWLRSPVFSSLDLTSRPTVLGGFLAGLALLLGASLQQVGLVDTTAGKAGFITGLYVILVPLLGMLWGQSVRREIWLGAVLAAGGLYFLSVRGDLNLERGDLWVLGGALAWACHVHVIGAFASRANTLGFAIVQFAVCSLFSTGLALAFESFAWPNLVGAAIPILYGGVMSAGVAFTLQVMGQRRAPPADAAIILSLEGMFAAVGGWMILGEVLTVRPLIGCCLMLGGMIVSQISFSWRGHPIKARR